MKQILLPPPLLLCGVPLMLWSVVLQLFGAPSPQLWLLFLLAVPQLPSGSLLPSLWQRISHLFMYLFVYFCQ